MQIDLFNENQIDKSSTFEKPLSKDTPQLVSFRELIPEITHTTYLTHSIYYYPAKFIPQVVKYCIDNYTKQNDWIIDPFAGSGTVGLEAILHRRNAVLIDLNLLLNHIIPIKIPIGSNKLELSILQEKLTTVFITQSEFTPTWTNIEYWYPAEILKELKRIWAGQKLLSQDLYAQIIQAVLIKISKQFSYAEHKAPKLFKSKSKKQYIENLLTKNWKEELKITIRKLCYETFNNINQFIKKVDAQQNEVLFYGGVDSSSFEMNTDIQIDCLITSPPYLQAQEYIRTVKLDLYWLGYSEKDIQRISKLEIPYRKATRIIDTQTISLIKNQLQREDLKNLLDSYFCHTVNAIENASKNLKDGGKACIFVGNPKIDGIEVETWKILMEYFSENGFEMQTVFEDRIKSRQLFKARKNKNPDGMKSEYLLVLEKKFS